MMHGTQNVKFVLYTLSFKLPINESKVLNRVNVQDKDCA